MLNAPKTVKPPKVKTSTPPKPLKIVAPIDLEIAVSMPAIFEVDNRGKGYRTFNFESPIDGSLFSFLSYKEARAARESLRPAICQLENYENVHRQSTGGKSAVDDEDDE
jgi:hypothetical protein